MFDGTAVQGAGLFSRAYGNVLANPRLALAWNAVGSDGYGRGKRTEFETPKKRISNPKHGRKGQKNFVVTVRLELTALALL